MGKRRRGNEGKREKTAFCSGLAFLAHLTLGKSLFFLSIWFFMFRSPFLFYDRDLGSFFVFLTNQHMHILEPGLFHLTYFSFLLRFSGKWVLLLLLWCGCPCSLAFIYCRFCHLTSWRGRMDWKDKMCMRWSELCGALWLLSEYNVKIIFESKPLVKVKCCNARKLVLFPIANWELS